MKKWQAVDQFLGAVARPEWNLLSKIAVMQWCEAVLLSHEAKAKMSTSEIAEFKAEVIEPTVNRLFQQVHRFSLRPCFFVQGSHLKTKFTNVNLPTQETRNLHVQVINVRSLYATTTALGTTTANLPMTSITTSYYQFFERPVAVGCINQNMPTIILQQENQHPTHKLWNLSLFRDDPADPRAGRLLRTLLDMFVPGSFWTFLYDVLQSLFLYFEGRHPPSQAHIPPEMVRDREETDDMRWTRLVTAYDPSAVIVTPPAAHVRAVTINYIENEPFRDMKIVNIIFWQRSNKTYFWVVRIQPNSTGTRTYLQPWTVPPRSTGMFWIGVSDANGVVITSPQQ
jgi:hypothetical protein